MTGWECRDISVPAAHPTASGHFPGRPVIPGALLLDAVAQAIAGNAPLSFRAVKFLAPASHGEPLELRWRSHEDGLVRFEIWRLGQDAAIVTGTLEVPA